MKGITRLIGLVYGRTTKNEGEGDLFGEMIIFAAENETDGKL